MGIINELMNVEQRATLQDVDNFLDWLMSSQGASSAGVQVNETEAMKHAAIFSCVKVIAETKASLPFIVYQRIDERAKKRAPNHWLYPLLHDRPNPEMTAFEYKELTMAHQLLWGNHYSFIERNQMGQIKGLWPLLPNKMEISRPEKNGPLVYTYEISSETSVQYEPREIWHLRGLGSNGIVGYSPIRQMAESIGFGIAVQKFGSYFFKHGTRLSGLLKHPGKLNKDVAKRVVKSFERSYAGLENVHRVALLEDGMEWVQLGVPPEDAQFLASRKFSRSEIAGIYRVPPHMIADLEKATFSNIEHQSIDFVVHCIRPWLTREENSVNVNLLGPRERLNFFAEFLVDALLRGDTQSRYQSYGQARQWGWMSANDIRALENLNPIEGGDVYYMPMNMLPASSAMAEPIPTEEEEEETEEGRKLKQFREFYKGMRQKRSISNRKRIRSNFIGVFKNAAKRIVNKESLAVKRAVERLMKKRKANNFKKWIDEFYGKLPKDIEENMMPVLLSYGAAVQEAIALEIGVEVGMSDELEDFLKRYLEVYEKRHIGSSLGQIGKIIEETNEDELAEALIERMDQWKERRPEKIARNEVVEAGGAVTKEIYKGAGILELTWVAGPDACPYCLELDGKTVGIEENFVDAHTDFEADGEPTMVIRRPTSHAPLHDGCECDIIGG